MGIVRSVKSWVGEHLIVKELLSDNELKQARLDTCNSCINNINGECRICGCVIEIKVGSKVSININNLHYEDTHCPVGKWPIRTGEGIGGNDLEIANYYRKLNNKEILKFRD